MQTTDLVQENKSLRSHAISSMNENRELKNEIIKLRNENNELRRDVSDLKSLVDDLRRDIGLIYKSTREFVKGRVRGVQAFKETIGSWVDKVKEKTAGDDLERSHKREDARERNKGMER